MSSTEQELRQHIVEVGRLLYEKGWVAANDGNISVRLEPGRILATPTQISKGRMREDDLIICDMEGNKVEGRRERTSEILMHLAVYEMRPDVQAVVHAHPPAATGFAVAGRPLNLALLPEVVVNLGCIPLADYGLPGTPELSESLRPFIPAYDALLMANHGVVCYGRELEKAFFNLETVEHAARITLVAHLLGGPRVLAREQVNRLMESRSRYGVEMPPGVQTAYPVAAEDAVGEHDRFLVSRDDLAALVDEILRVRR